MSESQMRRILVADDEPSIRELVLATLSADATFEVAFANDGRQAVERAREIRPDAVVLDVRMPEMDGHDVCRVLRAEHGPALFILMLTAMGRDSDRQAGEAAGADDYLTKPFSPSRLLARVREALDSAA